MKKTFIRLVSLALAALLCGCGVREQTDTRVTTEAPAPEGAGEFTYRQSLTQAPVNFSPFEWYTDGEKTVLEYTAQGLYEATLASDGASYEILPAMAAAMPEDVTAEYAGSWGIAEDAAEGYAFLIDLDPDACWADGTPITAGDYVESMKRLLSSEAKHYRASDWFSGALSLAGAYDYYMQDMAGQVIYQSLADAGYSSVKEAKNDGITEFYVDLEGYWGLECGWQSIESEEAFRDDAIPEGEKEDYVTPKYIYETYLAEGADYAAYQNSFVGVVQERIREVSWEDVGFLKAGNYRIVLILKKPMTAGNLAAALRSCFLVNTGLYDQDPDAYGTDPEHYISCGPYSLTAFDSRELRFARNENWHGYADPDYQGQYQATAISCRFLTEEQAVRAFATGQLDTVEAEGEDAYAIAQTYTSKLTFNTSLTALNRRESENVNKTILYYKDFRKAISLAIDRQAFVESCVPTAEPTLGLLNGTFLADLESGESYRDTAAGTGVLKALYGTEDVSSVTGFDLEQARTLLQRAYDDARSDGRIGAADVVELEFLTYTDGEVYRNIVSFLQSALDAAAEGTSLEGRIKILMTADENYYSTARTGQFEIILSTWGGDVTDPYSIMGSYCDRERIFEFGFDPSREICTMEVDGSTVSRTYRGWYQALTTGKYVYENRALREQVLAGLEYALLSDYNCVPIYERNRLFRDSERIERPVEEAVDLIGFGGVRYLKFTKDDAGLSVS